MVDMKEEISSLMDGEKTNQEREKLFKDIKQSHEMQQMWRRFHILRDLLASDDSKKDLAKYLDSQDKPSS